MSQSLKKLWQSYINVSNSAEECLYCTLPCEKYRVTFLYRPQCTTLTAMSRPAATTCSKLSSMLSTLLQIYSDSVMCSRSIAHLTSNHSYKCYCSIIIIIIIMCKSIHNTSLSNVPLNNELRLLTEQCKCNIWASFLLTLLSPAGWANSITSQTCPCVCVRVSVC